MGFFEMLSQVSLDWQHDFHGHLTKHSKFFLNQQQMIMVHCCSHQGLVMKKPRPHDELRKMSLICNHAFVLSFQSLFAFIVTFVACQLTCNAPQFISFLQCFQCFNQMVSLRCVFRNVFWLFSHCHFSNAPLSPFLSPVFCPPSDF